MEFISGFANKLNDALRWRTARGYKSNSHLHVMYKFDQYCSKQFPTHTELTSEIVHGWLEWEATYSRNYVRSTTVIRQFGKYLCAMDENAYILPDKYSPNRSRFSPYIFTDNELALLFCELDALPATKNEPYLCDILPTLLRLTYTCGLRPNEGRELLCEHVDLITGEILLVHTKQNKERIVVMSDDMLHLLQKYNMQRTVFAENNPFLFPSKNGGALTAAQVYAAFNKAWTNAVATANNPLPRKVRVYDLRHRFASACLNRWLDNGENLMNMLPYLRAYMGHNSLEETAYYIHVLPENLTKSPAIDWDVFNAMFPEVLE